MLFEAKEMLGLGGWGIEEMLGCWDAGMLGCWDACPVKQRETFLRSRVSPGLGLGDWGIEEMLGCWDAGMLAP